MSAATDPSGGVSAVAEPRRRGAAVEATVLDTTIALLAERGAAITVDDIAAASGVHKTTIYRRFETRELLVAAAIRRLGEQVVPPVDATDPRAALETLAVSVAAALRSPQAGNILRAAIAASAATPELVALADEFFRDRYELAREPLQRLVDTCARCAVGRRATTPRASSSSSPCEERGRERLGRGAAHGRALGACRAGHPVAVESALRLATAVAPPVRVPACSAPPPPSALSPAAPSPSGVPP
ncbi:MAG: hypothetical protein B7Y93_07205 [Micrococcales bacterium 32-70-13]|nr:MAG: hypothetical protein B7Y93_07205 [Micrococcales bacterium 32-70-13]